MRQHSGVSLSRRKGFFLSCLLCVSGIVINIAGSKIAGLLPFPLYLDVVGTILTAFLGGYIPGIAVGFLTNVINSISDFTSAYYGVLNILIAVFAAYFSQHRFFRKLPGALLQIPAYAIVGGALGSVLTWFLNSMGFGTGISAPLAHTLFDGGISSVFLAQLLADFLIDLVDKTVTLGLVFLILALLPARFKSQFSFHREQFEARSGKKRASDEKKLAHGMSLQSKVMLLISSAVILIAVVVISITFRQFHDAAIETQIGLGKGLARLVASYIDGNRVEDYLENGEEAEGYLKTKNALTQVMNNANDLEFIYAYKILPDGCHVVFDLDTADVEGEAPGTIIPFDSAFNEFLPALLNGEEIEPVISDETYGWLLTVYWPVYDDAGVCQCYAAVDLSMPRIVTDEQVFLTRIASLFMSFFILLTAIGIFLAKRGLILPIDSMAYAADTFAYNSEKARAESIESIRNLDIHTGDEIENLYHSLVKTTEDTVSYISDAQDKNEKISKLQNGLIMVLADLVESRDQCTGDHVRKTAAYTRIIMEQLRRDGVYTDILTDDYIQDVFNSAPLHDVGKIHVPDAVLNKPGKLTKEEFQIMQEHTTAGGQIISKAIATVSEANSGYLKEARNLAMYHHERWDGNGYPQKLKGEEIPLSARIMAVADVFDALVSKRSYKDGFPFEKAMGIIQEESGTHFDPSVVQAFLEEQDEVRRVAESYQSIS